ncbi:hypothetical protein [Haloplanus sp. C73]|uniref:hypothetical protein n=1 Tax=Haloplanus sp. C73 TaxID=3421641 RepID=UPI003EBE8396
MLDDYWEPTKRILILLSFISGISFGLFLILTPVLGGLTPFDGLEWTGVGILWILSTFWEFSRM